MDTIRAAEEVRHRHSLAPADIPPTSARRNGIVVLHRLVSDRCVVSISVALNIVSLATCWCSGVLGLVSALRDWSYRQKQNRGTEIQFHCPYAKFLR